MASLDALPDDLLDVWVGTRDGRGPPARWARLLLLSDACGLPATCVRLVARVRLRTFVVANTARRARVVVARAVLTFRSPLPARRRTIRGNSVGRRGTGTRARCAGS